MHGTLVGQSDLCTDIEPICSIPERSLPPSTLHQIMDQDLKTLERLMADKQEWCIKMCIPMITTLSWI